MEFKPFQGQDYEKIKSDCLSSGRLFEDPLFPASNESLFRFKELEGLNSYYIEWLRPHELSQSPKFEVSGFDTKDLNQGSVGNCWFIAGAIDIVTEPKYIERVVPKHQSFESGQYAGIFHFRFWNFGDWVDVVVDDRLPVFNGKLAFCSNRKHPDEFWGPLLEKAYAKLNVCYEFLDGGFTQDAIVDMTGGVTEYLDINVVLKTQSKDALWNFIHQAHKMGSLIGANIVQDANQRGEGRLSNGLLSGHAYSITKIQEILPNNKHFNHVSGLCSKTASHVVGAPQHGKRKVKRRIKKVNASTNVQGNYYYNTDSNYGYDWNNNNNYNIDNYNYPQPDVYNFGDGGQGGGGDEYEYIYEDDDNFGGDGGNNFGGDGGGDGGSGYTFDEGGEEDNHNNVRIDDADARGTNSAIRLMRLKNPWGDHHEWKGPWSDESPEWNQIDVNTKQELGLVCDNDGEFWMDFADFMRNFHLLCSVHVNLHAFMDEITTNDDETKQKWECKQYHDEWIPNKNAGGSGNNDPASFWTNPQFLISVTNTGESYSYSTGNYGTVTGATEAAKEKATLIVSLMCKDSTREKNRGELGSFPKQFRLFRVKNSDSGSNHRSTHKKFSSDELERVGSSHVYSLFREVSMRFRLDPGEYVVIPSTYDQNVAGKFLVRLFTESGCKISDVSILDINNYDNNNDSKENFNAIEDTLFDLIDRKILSNDHSSDSEGESGFDDGRRRYTDSTLAGSSSNQSTDNRISRFLNSSSSINSAFHSFKKFTKSTKDSNNSKHTCALS